MSYSVILPTLNEKGHIIELIKNIQKVFSEINQNYEIILVDDNSTDGTIEILKEIEKKYENLKLFVRENQKKNLAKSIYLGIKESKYENIIWMDADFQHPPDHLKFFHYKQADYDVIIFSRFLQSSTRYFDEDLSKKEKNENQSIFFNKLCRFFLYKDITDYTSGFICIKKKIFNNYQFNGYYGEYFIDLIIHCKKKNYSILELPFKEKERSSGSSKTMMGYTPKYIIICFNYFIVLFKNILKKILKI